MRVPRWTSTLPLLGGALLLALFPIGCSDDDSPTGTGGTGGGTTTLPASWGGIWQITSVPAPAPARGSSGDVEIFPLCAGLSAEELLGRPDGVPEFPVTCTGSWTDVAVDVTCSGSGTIEGCTTTFSTTLRLTRNGETFSGTESTTITTSGTCGDSETTTTDDIDGIRLDTGQFSCGANLDRALPASWGGTWDIVIESAGGDRALELLCPGEDIEDVFDAGDQPDVLGGFTDTTAEVFSTYATPAGQCLEIHTDRYELTRSGDTFTGTLTEAVYTVSDPSGSGGECSGEVTSVYNVTGTRMSTDTSGCGRIQTTAPRSIFGRR